ncbi:helix-turn-helix transcriptional regulator [Streptomyces sp. NPDC091292]|uniref:helix-turn-helix transcriptional regulator n=1 Tax=Streptomyces sp. NPDC091292 TaxID=3365991 RepID=UPI00382A5BA3
MPSDPGIPPSDPYPPHPPLPALTRLQEELRRAEATVTGMLEAGERQHRQQQGTLMAGLVELVEGREAQRRRLLELEHGARSTFVGCQSGANLVAPVPSTIIDPQIEPLPGGARTGLAGVDYRNLVDRDFLTEPAALRALDKRLEEGQQVRVVDHPLTKLVVVDDRLAMVRLSPERSMVLKPPLVMLVSELFEAHWRRSRPYLREEGDLGPADQRILQLMLSGLTDAATAKQLGTSPRTVQRRLRVLMDAAAVSSRVQLGWYAVRNNWV